jgi:predicted aspartyl protease
LRTYILRRLSSGLLATQAAVRGPSGVATLQLVIDTGAVYTVVHPSFLERIGTTSTGEISVRTLERTLRLPVFTVERVNVFGATLNQYPVLAYAPAAFTPGIDGVLSIDIFHTLKARLDFAAGVLTVP